MTNKTTGTHAHASHLFINQLCIRFSLCRVNVKLDTELLNDLVKGVLLVVVEDNHLGIRVCETGRTSKGPHRINHPIAHSLKQLNDRRIQHDLFLQTGLRARRSMQRTAQVPFPRVLLATVAATIALAADCVPVVVVLVCLVVKARLTEHARFVKRAGAAER